MLIFVENKIKMTKEEKIKEAYGELFYSKNHLIDTNGWFDNSSENDAITMGQTNFLGECDYKNNYWFRPKSLQGIENNNGWIKIESEEDLPGYGYYEVIHRKTGSQSRSTLDNDFGVKINLKNYSHYQKIKEIPNPIY